MIDPWDSASVADYRGWAIEKAREIESQGRTALFVGGTALYLKTLLRGLFDGPTADTALRERLDADAERIGDVAFHARLAQFDPITAARLPPGDRRRVVRALEVLELTGRPLSSFQTGHARPAEGAKVFALSRPREEMRRRIDARVVAMYGLGLLDEVRRLRSGPRPWHAVPSQAVGYVEAAGHLDGLLSLNDAVARTQARTRQFSKRQGTWFRGLAECRDFPIPHGERPEETARRIEEAVRKEG